MGQELKRRGLHEAARVVSDHHAGLARARSPKFQGVCSQRCQTRPAPQRARCLAPTPP
ncbi:MAG: transposase [Firmicutes bacterium]|nr:transposase [Alicyclobacillaceae bacterium]MCL6498398.1 transposase [Bacillota bacterium]